MCLRHMQTREKLVATKLLLLLSSSAASERSFLLSLLLLFVKHGAAERKDRGWPACHLLPLFHQKKQRRRKKNILECEIAGITFELQIKLDADSIIRSPGFFFFISFFFLLWLVMQINVFHFNQSIKRHLNSIFHSSEMQDNRRICHLQIFSCFFFPHNQTLLVLLRLAGEPAPSCTVVTRDSTPSCTVVTVPHASSYKEMFPR